MVNANSTDWTRTRAFINICIFYSKSEASVWANKKTGASILRMLQLLWMDAHCVTVNGASCGALASPVGDSWPLLARLLADRRSLRVQLAQHPNPRKPLEADLLVVVAAVAVVCLREIYQSSRHAQR